MATCQWSWRASTHSGKEEQTLNRPDKKPKEWFTSTQVSNIAASHAAPWATFPVDMKGVVLIKKSGPNRLPVINLGCNPGIQLLSGAQEGKATEAGSTNEPNIRSIDIV